MLHKKSKERFCTKFEHLAEIMEGLSEQATKCNADHASIELSFYSKGDKIKDGELVPSITLVVRRDDNLKD